MNFLPVIVVVCATFSSFSLLAYGQDYNDTKTLSDAYLSSTWYRTDVRPIINQTLPINVSINFKLVSIVEVNDVTQSFVCNGFLAIQWEDQMLRWDPSRYGWVESINPHPKDIWRPRMILINTLDKRDLFEDDVSPVTVYDDGHVVWIPGGLFKTACDLNMLKFPFDEQECTIMMLPMGLEDFELQYIAGTSKLEFYSLNGEWELTNTTIDAGTQPVESSVFSCFKVKFNIARRPTFFVLNILLPIVLLSLLNMLVFTIPADSGEKVSYGITVVLAMSVFLSIVSGMLPRSSDTVPLVIIYMFVLMVVSVLTVIDSIVIVFLYHREEEEDKSIKITRQYSTAANRISAMRHAVIRLRNTGEVAPLSSKSDREHPDATEAKLFQKSNRDDRISHEDKEKEEEENYLEKQKQNKYKLIGKYIDIVSLIVFLLAWLIITLWYFVSVLT